MIDIKLPELGEGISTVEISVIRVQLGDAITINDPIIIVETEKVSMEIPATSSGTITKIHVKKGDTIGPGDIIISISGDDLKSHESVTTIGNNTSEIKNGDQYTSQKNLSNKIDNADHTKTYSTVSPLGKPVLASPSVRRFARELGCDLKKVKGSGRKGRITQEDVQKYIKTKFPGANPSYG